MKVTLDLPDLQDVVRDAVESAITDRQTKLFGWKYYTLKETAELLQVKVSTLLDKRMPFLNEIEYSQSGKLFWFSKKSVEDFISNRSIRRYKR
ncbi:MAG: helix-turn-helix domain-containing protein [Bacteroidia bacterium]|jgi:hypothetical protein|nr:helix-turn-helix domain-containing protein [Bacteroidia bacterium]